MQFRLSRVLVSYSIVVDLRWLYEDVHSSQTGQLNPTLLNYLIPISNFAIAGSVLITAGVISNKDFSFSNKMPSTPVVTQSLEDSNVLDIRIVEMPDVEDIRIVEMPDVDVDLKRFPPLATESRFKCYGIPNSTKCASALGRLKNAADFADAEQSRHT